MDGRVFLATRWGSLQWVRVQPDAPPAPPRPGLSADEFVTELGFEPQPEPCPRPTVTVLGPVEVNGYPVEGLHPWKYNKAGELAVYLATRERPVSRDAAMEALWPDKAPDRPRLERVVSDCRVKAVGGADWLPAGSSVLELDADVDWVRWQRLRATATDDPERRRIVLSRMLELVAGPVFAHPLEGYQWAGGLAAEVRASVAETGLELARLEVERGDWRRGLWAARRGLRGDEWSVPLLEVAGVAARGLEDGGAMVWVDHKLAQVSGEST